MASNRIDKETLKGPDSFVSTSDKVFAWVQRYAVVVVGVVVLALVGSLGWLGYSYMQSQREAAAADAIYPAEAELKKAEETIRDERAEKMQAGDEKKKSAAQTPRPVDYATDYAPAVTKMKASIKEHAGTRTAVVSALNLSSFLLQQKQFAEALEVLNIPTYTPSTGNVLGGFWLMHRGVTLLENEKPDEAIQVYEKVLSSSDLKPFHSEAMLKLGVAYEVKGEAQKARETYERLGREFPDTEASNSAEQFLRLLDLKTQQG